MTPQDEKIQQALAHWEYTHEADARLIQADGWMCEQHPGREWPHDECAGPGMPWKVEGKASILALTRADALEAEVAQDEWFGWKYRSQIEAARADAAEAARDHLRARLRALCDTWKTGKHGGYDVAKGQCAADLLAVLTQLEEKKEDTTHTRAGRSPSGAFL